MTVAGSRPRRNRRGGRTDFDFGLDAGGAGPNPYTPPVMALLDDFNTGAAQNLNVRNGWSTSFLYNVGDSTYKTDATPTLASPLATPASNFWGSIFPADQEAWWTTANTGQSGMLLLRYQPGGAGSAIGAFINGGGSHQIQTTAGASLVSGTFPATAVGDRYAFCVDGTLYVLWRRANGSTNWVPILSTQNAAAYNGPGYIGWQVDAGNTPSISDFGGGSRLGISALPEQPVHVVRRTWAGR